MKLFKQKPKDKKALEQLIKENFCGKQSVVGCDYANEIWCPKTCGFYVRKLNEVKYWNR